MGLTIDHISYAAGNLDDARRYFRDAYGLDAVEGGSHPQWGTANLIVPLGRHFVEIVAVTDADVAATNPVGAATAARAAAGDRPFGLCLRSDNLTAEAGRLGLPLLPGERRYADGRVLTWRQLGIAEALGTLGLPYFFAYDDEALRLGARKAEHDIAPLEIVAAEIAMDANAFVAHTDGADLPVTFVRGDDGLRSITVSRTDGSTIQIGPRSASASIIGNNP